MSDNDRNTEDTDDEPPPLESGEAVSAEATGLELAEPRPVTDPDPRPEDPVESLRRERDELREQLLRRRAEFDNFRKRTERERQAWATDAEATIIRELIPTLDHLEQALRAEANAASIREGVALIERDLVATLARLGLAVHDPTGRTFDPLTDQALAQAEAPGVEEGTVVETFRRGFLYKERLIRPALVKVAAGAGNPASSPAPEEVH